MTSIDERLCVHVHSWNKKKKKKYATDHRNKS